MCGGREGGRRERERKGRKMRGRRGGERERENLQEIELIETLKEILLCVHPNNDSQTFNMKEWRKTTLYRRQANKNFIAVKL